MSLLTLRGVRVSYPRAGGPDVVAVAGVDLAVEPGEIVGLVGETGSGKSSLARAAVGLDAPSAGEILFDGRRVRPLGHRARTAREARLQMVFQNPYSSLNPRRRVGEQIADAVARLDRVTGEACRRRVAEVLEQVGLPSAAAGRLPHQFSGGQRQRVAIARALAARPSLLVLDEPLSSLDVSVQAQVANLLVDLARQFEMSMLLISHDLGIVRQVADRIAVMYLGLVVESGPASSVWAEPGHPYTSSLIGAIPRLDVFGQIPAAVLGEIPDPARPPSGCRFSPRCPCVMDRCRREAPTATAVTPGHDVSCWLRTPTADSGAGR